MIAFIQPFGFEAPGGGSRILRGLLDCDHPPAISICTAISGTPPSLRTEEIVLPLRPFLGRLERTRYSRRVPILDGLYRSQFEKKLRRVLHEQSIKLLHLIPHAYDIVPVLNVAQELKIPYFVNVHDDIEYTMLSHPLRKQIAQATAQAWRNAIGVFVISDAIGREYSSRYGERSFASITDGLTTIAEAPQPRPARSLRVYFMGIFHIRYSPNLRALLDALKQIQTKYPDWKISVTCRCGTVHRTLRKEDVPVCVLPFSDEKDVEQDMQSADILYLPLPFQDEAAAFGKFSLSTKLVTYLGSGIPVLYHGPADAAASTLLKEQNAAFISTSLDPELLAKQLIESVYSREAISQNALRLARERFRLSDQQQRFWEPIQAALGNE